MTDILTVVWVLLSALTTGVVVAEFILERRDKKDTLREINDIKARLHRLDGQ